MGNVDTGEMNGNGGCRSLAGQHKRLLSEAKAIRPQTLKWTLFPNTGLPCSREARSGLLRSPCRGGLLRPGDLVGLS
jgi:hypothetical protein